MLTANFRLDIFGVLATVDEMADFVWLGKV